MTEKKAVFLECPICGAIFQKRGARNKFCSPKCSEIGRERRIRAYQAKWKRMRYRQEHPNCIPVVDDDGKPINTPQRKKRNSERYKALNAEIKKEPRICQICGEQYWPKSIADMHTCIKCKKAGYKAGYEKHLKCSVCGRLTKTDPCPRCQAEQRGRDRNG